MTERDPRVRDELESAVGARRELGEEMEPAVIEAFLDRIEKRIDQRVDERLARRPARRDDSDEESGIDKTAVAIGVGSLGVSIPIMGALAGLDDPAATIGVIFAWVTIVVVNVAHAVARRRG